MDVILYSAWQKRTPGQEDHLGGSFAQCTLLVSSSYLILNVPSSYPPCILLVSSSYPPRTLHVPSTYPPRILLVSSSYTLYPPRTLLVPSSYPSHKYQPLQICPTVWWASFVPSLCTDQVQIGKTWGDLVKWPKLQGAASSECSCTTCFTAAHWDKGIHKADEQMSSR